MRRFGQCLIASIAFVLLSGCAPRRTAVEVPPHTPGERSGTTRLTSAQGQRKPSKPASSTTTEAHPLAKHYVSNYVRMDAATLEHLTGAQRADLFERVPLDAFVYAYADLDETSAKEVRGSYLEDRFPHRDEPLLVLRASKEGDRPVVTTADGVEVAVDWARLSDGSTSTPTVAGSPRVLRSLPEAAAMKASALASPNTDSGWVSQALHPLAQALGAEISNDEFWQTKERIRRSVRATADSMDSCRARVSATFDPQVRAGTWTSEAPSGRTITVTSPRARQAEEKAAEQSDKVCGDRAALQKKLAAIYDAEDSKIRGRLTSERARLFERSTARFRASR